MAVRKMNMKRWKQLVEASQGKSHDVQGDSPGGVAARLGCTRQAVHRLIKRGTLDAVAVYDGDELAFYIVPEASLAAYQQTLAARLSKRLSTVLGSN
jgi:hypothetical protein